MESLHSIRPALPGVGRAGALASAVAAAVVATLSAAVASGCAGTPSSAPAATTRSPSGHAATPAGRALPPLLADLALPAVPDGPRDPDGPNDGEDGEDDGEKPAPGPLLAQLATARYAEFRRVAPPPGAHPLVCDLTPMAGALYASFAASPINLDGARVYRYRPAADARGADRFDLVFDWDRGGAPRRTHEVGGQGLTRLRAIGGRLYATDSDAPLYGGFGLTDAPFEDYLFASDATGAFPPLGPEQSPPAGTVVLPLAFHVFDVISYRGALVATGGTVRAGARVHGGGSPGTRYPAGLFVGAPGDPILAPRYRPGEGERVGVVRATYMHRFAGRLYVGFQNNERRIRWDLAVLTGDPLDARTPPPVLARVTPDGGWLTRRFASANGTLYWIASGYPRDRRGAALFGSRDGVRFERARLPAGAGAPQDIAVVGGAVYLLAQGGIYRMREPARGGASGQASQTGVLGEFARLAEAPPGDPFGRWDSFCSAPLVAFADALYAGSTRDGALYRVEPVP